jgi:arylsulfatase A-like enzyme
VVDSLCCPSRASIFTGRPPHQTGVLTNVPNDPADPIGGYRAFVRNDNAEKAFNVPLQKSGYTTGFVGKYMNGYEMSTNYLGKHLAPAKIAGWDSFEAWTSCAGTAAARSPTSSRSRRMGRTRR